MATICIIDPGSPLVEQVLIALDSILTLYGKIQPTVPQEWAGRNLQWLHELRKRGCEKIVAFRAGQDPEGWSVASVSEKESEHLLLDGWKERLVKLGHRSSPAPPVELNDVNPLNLQFDIPGSEEVSHSDVVEDAVACTHGLDMLMIDSFYKCSALLRTGRILQRRMMVWRQWISDPTTSETERSLQYIVHQTRCFDLARNNARKPTAAAAQWSGGYVCEKVGIVDRCSVTTGLCCVT